jgi:hypothetical protein
MSAESRSEPERIEAAFRHGTITAVGVLTAFSLGFLTAWGANPIPWGLKDLFAFVPIVGGVAFELVALAKLLDHRVLEMPRYKQAVRIFLIGIVLVATGVVIALAVDFISIGSLETGADAAR